MSEIKIHIFHIGKVCVAPELPFGGEHYSALKASGVLDRKSKRLWLPVSAYLIECAHGNVLFDCGWHRDMSPHGVNGLMGSAGRSYDVFGDGMLMMVNIPGHSKGLCALRITGEDGRLRRRRPREKIVGADAALRHRRRPRGAEKVARVDQGTESGAELRCVHRQPRFRCQTGRDYIIKE